LRGLYIAFRRAVGFGVCAGNFTNTDPGVKKGEEDG
jgi:hypothetical protein